MTKERLDEIKKLASKPIAEPHGSAIRDLLAEIEAKPQRQTRRQAEPEAETE